MYASVSLKCIYCQTPISASIAIPETTIGDETFTSDSQVIECDVCRRHYHAEIVNSGGVIDVSIQGVNAGDISVSHPEVIDGLVEATWDWRSDYDWYVNLTQKTVFQYFSVSFMSIRDMFTVRIDDRNQSEMLNRMLLVQCISCLEAYLSDTLIARVTTLPSLLAKLYEVDSTLRNEKILVSEFIADNDLPLKKSRVYLEGLVYHNIPKIEALYRQILDVSFEYGDGESKNVLFSAIQSRHDFVHRNGKTKETGDLRMIDKKYISRVLLVIEHLVGQIEARLKQIDEDDIPF